MNPVPDELSEINLSFQKLLASPEPAEISPAHSSDELMVWFLLGGKDVGKSTFLNALLGTEGSRLSSESVEGTQRFFAYIHESAVGELRERLEGLSIDVDILPHTSEKHQRLCLIDSPDFDSRFERHASQVGQVVSAGVTDGAVMLASPEKYKNVQYWSAFQDLSSTLSPRHILFVLTKADELGHYLQEARDDFTRTVSRRMAGLPDREPDPAPGDDVYLINSLERSLDFNRLESRLMRKLTAGDVRSAQHDNMMHAITRGSEQIREHYRLEEVRGLLQEAADPDRLEDICQDAFPDVYFQTVASRLAGSRDLISIVRERNGSSAGEALAGVPALLAAVHWVGERNPFRLRRSEASPDTHDQTPELDDLTRWGNESLEKKLHRSQREVLSGTLPEHPEAIEPFLENGTHLRRSLGQLLEELLSQPATRLFPFPVRWILNLPVYLYLIFFLFLLFSPVFLFLKAWGVPHMPDFKGVLALDNVKVAVIGFAGYYVMALLYVIRKQRDRTRRETISLSRAYVREMDRFLHHEVSRPLTRFQETFSELESRLERAVLSRGRRGG